MKTKQNASRSKAGGIGGKIKDDPQKNLTLLYEAGLALNRELNPQSQMHSFFEIVKRGMNAEDTVYFRYDEEASQLHAEFGVGPELDMNTFNDLHFPLGEELGLVGLVAETRMPLYLPDVQNDPRWIKVGPPLHSVIWVPVEYENKLLGVFTIASKEVNAFTKQDEQLLVLFANQLAIAMENARLFEAFARELTERKQAESELKRSHSLLNSALESTADGILVVDLHGNITGYNRKFLEMWNIPNELGREKDDRRLLNFVLSQLKHPQEFITRVDALYHSPEATSFDELEFLDGRIFERYSQPQRMGDTILGRVWSFRDVTDRKHAEQSLRASEGRYRNLFENSPMALWEEDFSEVKQHLENLKQSGVTDIRGYFRSNPQALKACMGMIQILDVNETAVRMYEAESKEALIRSANEDASTGEVEHNPDDCAAIAEGVTSSFWEGSDTTLKNRPIEIRLTWSVVPGHESDYSRVIVITHDVTEQKRAEEALRQSESRFRALIENSSDEISLLAADGSLLYESPSANPTLGYATGEFIRKNMFQLVHPQDVERVQELFRQLVHTPGASLRDQFRLKHKSGTWVWVDALGTNLLEEPSVGAVVVNYHDITERKQVEEKIRESENRYQLAVRATKDIIWEWDMNTDRVFWNENSYSVLGYKPDEVNLHSTWWEEQIHPQDSERVAAKLDAILASGDSIWADEYRFLRRDGSYATIVDRGFVEYDSDGRGIRMIGAMSDISARKRMENALQQSEERYRALFEDSPVSIWEEDFSQVKSYFDSLYSSGVTNIREHFAAHPEAVQECIKRVQVLNVNQTTLNLMQVRDKSELISSLSESLAEEAIPILADELASLAEGNLSYENDEVFTTRRGEKRQVYFRLTVAPGYEKTLGKVFVSFLDITGRKQAEAETLRHLDELQAVYENGLDVGRLLSPRQIGERVIQTFTQYLSWHHVTIRLRKGDSDNLELIAFNVPPEEREEMQKAEQNLSSRITKVGQGMSGWVAQTGVPIRTGNVCEYPQYVDMYEGIESGMYMPLQAGDQIIGSISVESKLPDAFTLQDERLLATLANQAAIAFENARLYQAIQQELGERRHAEELLEQERNSLAMRVEERTAELIAANSNLARALRVKDEFLANMSHELRTPLNAILGLSESLSEQVAGPLNEKQQKYLQTITESGHHLLALINDILDLAKIEAGQVTLDISKVDINLLCQSSLRMVKQMAQKKKLHIAVEIDEKVSLIWADERRLKQMIVNLLSNAVKFTPEVGKIGLEVHGDEAENRVQITVWDTGIGIAESQIPQLFQPFIQLSTGLARESTGTGLGLALVAQMARLHGGGVSVTSKPGAGSRFTLILPWEPALPADTVERMKVTGKFRAIKPNETRQRRTILLVEDTNDVGMMVGDYLEAAGYNVVIAKDGLDGVAEARRIQPHLILMDLQMPRMDGFEATRELRNDAAFKNTPIIALTALAMQGDRERCLAVGMDEYITKPVNLKALVKIIEACLKPTQ